MSELRKNNFPSYKLWKSFILFLTSLCMRKNYTIILFSLLLIPLIWNGVSFIHFLVEHTHTFCASEQDHQHTSTDICHTICHVSPQHDQGQIPHNIEFYELKQCITALPFFDKQFSSFNSININPEYSLLYNRIISEDIFRPPIS